MGSAGGGAASGVGLGRCRGGPKGGTDLENRGLAASFAEGWTRGVGGGAEARGLPAGRGWPGRAGAGRARGWRLHCFRCCGRSTSPGARGFCEPKPPSASGAPALGSPAAMAGPGPGPGDPDEQYDFLFKLVLVGDASVGKTCVVQRFKTGAFSERQSSTIGVDFTMKTLEIQGKRVKVGGPA